MAQTLNLLSCIGLCAAPQELLPACCHSTHAHLLFCRHCMCVLSCRLCWRRLRWAAAAPRRAHTDLPSGGCDGAVLVWASPVLRPSPSPATVPCTGVHHSAEGQAGLKRTGVPAGEAAMLSTGSDSTAITVAWRPGSILRSDLTLSLAHAVAAGPHRQGLMPGPFTIRAPAGIRTAHLLGFHSGHHHLGPGDPQLAAQAAAAKGAAAVLAPSTQDLLGAAADGWLFFSAASQQHVGLQRWRVVKRSHLPRTAVCMHGVAAGQDSSTRLLTR